jgi:hypothetical protein
MGTFTVSFVLEEVVVAIVKGAGGHARVEELPQEGLHALGVGTEVAQVLEHLHPLAQFMARTGQRVQRAAAAEPNGS